MKKVVQGGLHVIRRGTAFDRTFHKIVRPSEMKNIKRRHGDDVKSIRRKTEPSKYDLEQL